LKESISPSCQLSPLLPLLLLSSLLYSTLLSFYFYSPVPSLISYIFSPHHFLPVHSFYFLPSFLSLVYSSPLLSFASLHFTSLRFTPPLPSLTHLKILLPASLLFFSTITVSSLLSPHFPLLFPLALYCQLKYRRCTNS
jgi:hypothetical protein